MELGSGTSQDIKTTISLCKCNILLGLCSTPLLHNIVHDQVDEGVPAMLYTIDSDQEWLEKFHKYEANYHQQFLVHMNWTVLSEK